LRARRSLIDLDDFTGEEIRHVFQRAKEFIHAEPPKLLTGRSYVNMFFEQSTRTYTSFVLAEQRLGAYSINLHPSEMSLATKGETIEDTMITLGAMGINGVVVRHSEAHFPERVAAVFDGHVINAGDGAHAHPTQALLDLYTLYEEFGNIQGRSVAIVGDIVHSRVAHSVVRGLLRLGANVLLVGPEAFLPSGYADECVAVVREFDTVLGDVDAVVLLRIQRERFAAMPLSDVEYVAGYQLNERRLKLLAREAIVMHPGPYNRGMELDDTVLEFAGWRYARQVHNGVYIRMAVLDLLENGVQSEAKPSPVHSTTW
jgi:aspartate carbamoyltransferase catalytic subunit